MLEKFRPTKIVRAIGSNKRENVRIGDQYRDQGAWDKAAESYKKHVATDPEDFAIWVQLGNCLKEAGQYSEARNAYGRAIALNDGDADVFLQHGHLLKTIGRPAEAIASYRRALELSPDNQDAFVELLNLNAAADVAEVLGEGVVEKMTAAKPTVWLDVTDLVDYSRHNGSLSGIQRVVANLVSYSSGLQSDNNIVPVMPEYHNFRVFSVNAVLVKNLISMIEGGTFDRKVLDAAIGAIDASRREVTPVKGDSLILAGAFWVFDHYDMIVRLRQCGVFFGLFLHDLIQIKNPQYVHREATLVFQRRLVDALQIANFVLTNSEFVAGEVRGYLAEKMNFTLPVKAIPLATELRPVQSAGATIPSDILDAASREFVLCVCTIEVRKNHIYLLRIWERLRKELKKEDLPDLVFVGKWGWDIAPLREYIDKAGVEGDWLHIFNGISDVALEHLYQRCLFTSYVSFAEGFGLPVGESLAHGKPCIASNVTSMPEVGGALAHYVDPFNVEAGYEVFRRTIQDRAGLAAWTKQIQGEFKPKSWQKFSEEFFAAVAEFAKTADLHDEVRCIIPEGTIAPVGDDALQELVDNGDKAITPRMARVSGWCPVQGWGVWASRRRAKLRFLTGLTEGEHIKIYMGLKLPGDTGTAHVLVRCGGVETRVEISGKRFVLADGVVSANGAAEMDVVSQGAFAREGDREVFVGLLALAYCRSGDALGRISLLEKVTLYKLD